MVRYYQYKPFVVEDFEASEWAHPPHNHNYYELIFIKYGKGIHYVHNIPHPYVKGDIFLLGPQDEHYFDIKESTRFMYVKFPDIYMYKETGGSLNNFQKLEYLIKSRETHFSGFRLKEEDLKPTEKIFDVILTLKDHLQHNEQLLWMQVLAVAMIMQRNMPELKPTNDRNKDMQAVFCYLHANIYDPQKLRAEAIAVNFNISEGYIGPYFKRNAGVTIREYIKQYRKTLINQRIASGYSLKEVAVQFGLTDESHVKKILK